MPYNIIKKSIGKVGSDKIVSFIAGQKMKKVCS